jgi:SAM-dependent methyltransferase
MKAMRVVRQLMRVDAIRACILLARYLFLARILGRLRVYQDPTDGVSANTVKYNLTAFSRPLLLQRTRLLVRPLSVIETLSPDSAILVVGPRSEDDLLHLSAYGFRNVRGLDLISYSPRIDLGDMHKPPYADSTFDAVLYGWVLGYSDDPERAAKEAIRVVRDGGIVGIGAEHYPRAELLSEARVAGGVDYPTGGRRINTAAEHLELFRGHVKQVFFTHDVGEQVGDRMSNTCVIFAVKK